MTEEISTRLKMTNKTKFKVRKIANTPLEVAVGDRSTTFMFPPKKGNYFKIRDKLSEEGLHIPSIRELSDLLYCAINHENSGRDKLDLSGLVLEHFQSGIQSSVYFLYSPKRILGGDRAEVVYLLQDSGLDHMPDEEELKTLSNVLRIPVPVEPDFAIDKHPLMEAIFGKEMLAKLSEREYSEHRPFRIHPCIKDSYGSLNLFTEDDRGFLSLVLAEDRGGSMTGWRDLFPTVRTWVKPFIYGITNPPNNQFSEISKSEYRSYQNAVTRERKEKEHRDSLPSHDDFRYSGFSGSDYFDPSHSDLERRDYYWEKGH